MFTIELFSEIKRNKSVFTMNDNMNWCDGAGDHRLKVELSDLNKENSRPLSLYFRQIHELIRKLEYSLAISRNLENQEAIRITMLQAENIRLTDEIVQLTKKKQMDENVEALEINKNFNNDLRIYEPCETMSIVNLQYKYNELWDSYQKILQTLTNKDKQLKIYKDQVTNLENELNKKKNASMENDFKIYELCIKYLRLKRRRDKVEHKMKKEINNLQQYSHRAAKKLADYIANNNVCSQKERPQRKIQQKIYKYIKSTQ